MAHSSIKQRKKDIASATAALPTSSSSSSSTETKNVISTSSSSSINSKNKTNPLVPLPLIAIVCLCSGSLWMLALRDLFRTGQVILGPMDEQMLQFTHSTDWYDSSRGWWKSTQGGFSAIQSITTDANNMGGFFVRKLTGAASLIVHSQKLFPLLFSSSNINWSEGHYDPLVCTAIVGNIALILFYLSYQTVFIQANANTMSLYIISVSMIEALSMMGYLIHRWFTTTRNISKPTIIKYPMGKNASSLVSNIVARTVGIITALMILIASRDLFFPGQEIGFPPMDDIYLEWTGAFIHSPPPGSIEEQEYSLEAPLHIGDLFISQLCALYILIFCFQKLIAAFGIRYGIYGQGLYQCLVFWKIQSIGDGLLLLVFRAFASSAKSASLDVRWHLMCLGYEACILALYGYF